MAATIHPNPSPEGERRNVLPPPITEVGVIGWMRGNLFSSRFNSLLTVVSLAVTVVALFYGLRWVIAGADWTVIGVLGGQMVIGQYNTEGACPGQNCFWRPQVALLLVSVLLGLLWGMLGGGVARRLSIGVVVVLTLFAFLPYGFDRMGMDVRLLLVANIPALLLGWAVAHFLGISVRGIVIYVAAAFIVTVVLMRGLPGVPGLQPVLVIHWGGLTLNLLLAVVPIGLSVPIGIALALGRRSNLNIPLGDAVILIVQKFCMTRPIAPLVGLLGAIFGRIGGSWIVAPSHMARTGGPQLEPGQTVLRGVHRGVPGRAADRLAVHVAGTGPAGLPRGLRLQLPRPGRNHHNAVQLGLYGERNIRGGLQALHPGQAEAARALGLPGWQTTMLISLPQAIRNVIPAIVGQFISLYKDTTPGLHHRYAGRAGNQPGLYPGQHRVHRQRQGGVHLPGPGVLGVLLHHVLRQREGRRTPGCGPAVGRPEFAGRARERRSGDRRWNEERRRI